MIVECQNCRTRFNVDPSRIKEDGSKVKCSNCANIFKIFRPAPEPTPEPPAPPEEPLVEAGDDFEAFGEETPGESPEQAEGEEVFSFGESDDLDLGDLGEPPAGATPEEPGEADDDLDFGSLDDDLGLGEAALEPPVDVKETTDFGEDVADDDLDFGSLGDDLDMGEPQVDDGPEAAVTDDLGEMDDDLDFGGLDDELDMGEPQVDGGPETAVTDDLGEINDDLDFGGLDDDLDLGEPGGETEPAPAETDDLDDLDFDGLDDAFGLTDEEEGAADDEAGGPSFKEGDDVFGDLDLGDEPSSSDEGDDKGFDFGESTLLGDEPRDEFEGPGGEDDEISYMGGYDEDGEDDFSAEFAAAPRKKKGRGCLWVLVFIFLVMAGLAGVFFFAPQILEPVLKPLGLIAEEPKATDDPQGNKYISPENAKHFFRQNETEGQLLVITGLAKNHYPEARSFIRLKGLLHDAKGQVLAERQVYCGNLLTEEELSTMTMEDIQKRLNARGGQEGENVNVPSGQSVRFMIVFNQIPIDLAEYTVEAFTSEPAESK